MRHVLSSLTALGALVLLAATAPAAEGVLPIRAGDTVRGTLARCGDRHLLRLDLVRGEVLRARVSAEKAIAADITLRVYAPDGTLVNTEAHVRGTQLGSQLGPFPVTETGTYHLQLTTFTRHELPYELRTKARRRPAVRVRLRGDASRGFTAAAGSLLRVRGAGAANGVSLVLPHGDELALAPSSACLAALSSDGLTAPEGGRYRVALSAGGRGRLVAQPPGRHSARTIAFPVLPEAAEQVSAWYDDAGWVADPLRAAPADHEPPSTTLRPDPPAGPPPVPTLTSVLAAPRGPWRPEDGVGFGDPAHPGGIAAGLGMPISPVPTIEQTLALGTIEPFGEGPSYAFDVEHAELGSLTYRVQFLVGGVAAQAPVSAAGGVTMRWTVTGGAATHDGRWALTWDGTRGVEVLAGSETLIDASSRLVQSAADGFTLRADGGPSSGRLSYAVTWLNGPFPGGAFRRVETHDGHGGSATVID